MVRRRIRDADEARAALDAVARSDLPRAAWARAQGIDPRSLNAWRVNLSRCARRAHAGTLRLVELVPSPSPAARYVVRAGPWEVEVDDHFDADVLRRLLGVVAGC